MREIEFRAIDTVYPCHWSYGSIVVRKDKCFITNEGCMVKVIAGTVGQSIGLLDANGKKIYEGDICKDICDEKLYEIRYCNEWVGFYFFDLKNKSYKYSGDIFLPATIEVIGNVFENADLLK